jgi:1-aminocyclopropane-1-carboxylate deaminase/D-cysteine desulfhydrase-like pyridoxal-dependent ACC family enzyme
LLIYKPIIQKLEFPLFKEKEITVSILRLDLIHEQISGNKWFKLKYNLEAARNEGHDAILTFGGAFSNHILATAMVCKLAGVKCIGIIRGEKDSENNPTLSNAKAVGMQLHFVSREDYKRKSETSFVDELHKKFGKFYLIPEGGNNLNGARGCQEILKNISETYHYIFCACGTGTTFAGLAASLKENEKLIGISVLKGEQTMIGEVQNMVNEIRGDNEVLISTNDEMLSSEHLTKTGIINEYHFGGYAKHTRELLDFKFEFEKDFNIPLDYVYTAKLFFAVNDLVSKNKIPERSDILIIHSGGLQGNKGYEQRYALNPIRIVTDIQGKD